MNRFRFAALALFAAQTAAAPAPAVAQPSAAPAPAPSPYIAPVTRVAAAELLMPFSLLDQTAAGRAVLAANLKEAIRVNRAADGARRAQALADIAILPAFGAQFTQALGTRIDTAYAAALKVGTDPHLSANGPIAATFAMFTGFTKDDSGFDKTFFADGTSDNRQPVGNIALPPGGAFDAYDFAYLPAAPRSLNPNGNARPYQVAPQAIDQFASTQNAQLATSPAFPSGHTTYGFTESLMIAVAVPERFGQVLARAADYGFSRVVVGAHYPLDVIGGRILATHDLARLLNGAGGNADAPARFAAFAAALRGVIADTCGAVVAVCAASPDTGRFADGQRNRADYRYRLTYGLPATGATGLAPVVPPGAEVLLATRFPYMSPDQRRAVLASTEIASGSALDDGSGWARLDLFAAGGGYGAFEGVVTVVQDAGSGEDRWSNAIGGTGGLSHPGEGVLTLTGANRYSGGTSVGGGRLVAASASALGRGDVAVGGGELVVAQPLRIGGGYRQTGGALDLRVQAGARPDLTIAGVAELGGALAVDLGRAGAGARRSVRPLLAYRAHRGRFAAVGYAGLAHGWRARLIYGAHGVSVAVAPLPRARVHG